MNKEETGTKKMSGKKKLLFSAIIFFIVIFLILFIAEVVLRVAPIPGVKYNIGSYDSITGSGFYPNGVNIYRNDRGDHVKRKINEWGYFDRNYAKEKKAGTIRVGFFGDSFTQAAQVPLEQTFHYLIGDSLKNQHVETLSFGVSGYSTYQAYLTSNKWADFFDIDIIVYVFFENDIGDQIRSIKKEPLFVYPLLKDSQLVADNSFRELAKNRNSFSYRTYSYLTANFLVFSTITERIKLLRQHGVKVNTDEKDRLLKNAFADSTVKIYPPNLDQVDPPPLWPDSLRTLAMDLERAVLLNWKDQLAKKNKKLVVLYTPNKVKVPATAQNSWKPFVQNLCLENEIPFIDPTDELIKTEQNGFETFYDHYTKYGHQAVCSVFASWYLTRK